MWRSCTSVPGVLVLASSVKSVLLLSSCCALALSGPHGAALCTVHGATPARRGHSTIA